MNTYEILKNAHSGWRYLVLVLLLIAFFQALVSWIDKKEYSERNRKLNVFALISAHIQLVLGIVLYFLSPLTKGPMGEAMYRYWKVEHISIMIIAIILITVGNARSKKGMDGAVKHKNIAVFFGLALITIFIAIMMMVNSDPSKTLFGIS